MDATRTHNARIQMPENLSVEELNQAVRDLREMLYQNRLRAQQIEEQLQERALDCERRSAKLSNDWDHEGSGMWALAGQQMRKALEDARSLIKEMV